jgi:hypothetical protein
VLVKELNDVAQPEPPLATRGTVMSQPTAIRVSANGSRADAQQPRGFLKGEFRVEQATDELLSALFELATIIVGGNAVVVETTKEGDVFR